MIVPLCTLIHISLTVVDVMLYNMYKQQKYSCFGSWRTAKILASWSSLRIHNLLSLFKLKYSALLRAQNRFSFITCDLSSTSLLQIISIHFKILQTEAVVEMIVAREVEEGGAPGMQVAAARDAVTEAAVQVLTPWA